MTNAIKLLLLLASLATAAFAAGPGHDMYVCAAVNNNYVIGSKYVTMSGLFRLDGKGGWEHIGFNDIGLMAVSFDPRDHKVFYSASLNGCIRTFDGGQHVRVTTSWDVTEPRDVAVDPNAPDTVYLAAPDGIMVSTNRADTWTRRENGLPARGRYTQAIRVDRGSSGRVFAGCETGIYLTENAGRLWRRVLPTDDTVLDIQQSPADPHRWVAVTQSAGGWSSADNGVTWKRLPGLPSEHALYNISFDATNPRRLAVGSYTYGVLTSEDDGATWTARNDGLPEKHEVWRVAVHPDTGTLYAGVLSSTLFSSDDFGHTWKPAGLPSSRVSSFCFVPKNQH